jgi:hypothetical protein
MCLFRGKRSRLPIMLHRPCPVYMIISEERDVIRKETESLNMCIPRATVRATGTQFITGLKRFQQATLSLNVEPYYSSTSHASVPARQILSLTTPNVPGTLHVVKYCIQFSATPTPYLCAPFRWLRIYDALFSG